MMNNGDYPYGAANDPAAPYNKDEDNIYLKCLLKVVYTKEVTMQVPREVVESNNNELLKEVIKEQEFLPMDYFSEYYYKFREQVRMPKEIWKEESFEIIRE